MRLKASAQLSLETTSPTPESPGKEQLIMAENQSSLQELQGRSQDFTFARRNFLRGLASAVLPFFISRPQSLTPFGCGKPEFSIGNKVRASWEAEPGVFRSEYGQVAVFAGIQWNSNGSI
jgi:hypothetical protein